MNNLIDPLSPALLSGIAVLLCGFNTIMFIKRYRWCKANKYIQPRWLTIREGRYLTGSGFFAVHPATRGADKDTEIRPPKLLYGLCDNLFVGEVPCCVNNRWRISPAVASLSVTLPLQIYTGTRIMYSGGIQRFLKAGYGSPQDSSVARSPPHNKNIRLPIWIMRTMERRSPHKQLII